MNIGFIGTGSMGRAIIPLLLEAGHRVSAWNRSREALEDLRGVRVLATAAAAFEEDVIISMLADDHAVRAVLSDSGILNNVGEGRIHVVMSTLSPVLMQELQAAHDAQGIALIAAPVFGVPAVAAKGELNIMVAGSATAIATVQPLFDVLGKKTWWMGSDPVHASIAKIAGNMMITQAIQSLGEASALAGRHGLSPAVFIDLVTQTLFASPSYQRYGHNIVTDSYEPGFRLSLGLKDINLAIDAAHRVDLDLPAADAVRAKMTAAIARGLGHKDWSIFATETIGRSAECSDEPGRSAPV